ncbi:MAG: DUF2784 family protein [Thermoguttaceae bacterium]|jgi:hypothetical protein|nr:DUF2784 family protein [Thermoguttaceae bacterium]
MSTYRCLADLVVALHAGYVLAVVLGLVAIYVGLALRWGWVRNFWFRTLHFLMIVVVVLESYLGVPCPLTTLEDYLRAQAGETVSEASFVGRWANAITFWDIPEWVLTIVYSVFAAVVLATLVLAPPRWPRPRR